MTFLYPMRPGLSVPNTDAGRAMLPKDWWYQPKLDDERAMVHASGVYTRFGKPFDRVKLRKFEEAIGVLRKALCNRVNLDEAWLDVALIGYRKTRPPYRVVLLDIPSNLTYRERVKIPRGMIPAVFGDGGYHVTYMPERSLGAAISLAESLGSDCEGIIGRDPDAPYISGESNKMIKMRWK